MNIVDLVLPDLSHILCNFCQNDEFVEKDGKHKKKLMLCYSFYFLPCLSRSKNARAGYIRHYFQYAALILYDIRLQFGFVEFDHVSDPPLDSQETRLTSAASAESVWSSCPSCHSLTYCMRHLFKNTTTEWP